MKRKKVLIITYYWPPSGGIAVQRWVKFVKYLPGFDWEPIVYTVSNGEYALVDHSLEGELAADLVVIKRPIWEPYQWYQLLSKAKKGNGRLSIKLSERAGLAERISLWVRSNIFIPDARRFWIKPSVRFLVKFLSETKVDVIITTGPPHSLHLIGLEVVAKTKIPWIADFRDPWTSMDYYKDLQLTRWADEKHHRLEKEVLQRANAVIAVGKMMQREFEEKRGALVEYLPNGYDLKEFFVDHPIQFDYEFTIVHAGSLFERRNPLSLWKAMTELRDESHPLLQKIKIKLLGRVDETVLKSIQKNGLHDFVQLIPFVPHPELVTHLQSAQVLLLPIDNFEGAKWVLTGKLFEYLAAQRPVLCIGPVDGDAAEIIYETGVGEIFDFEDVAGIKKYMVTAFGLYEKNSLTLENPQIGRYSLQGLTQKLADILNHISK